MMLDLQYFVNNLPVKINRNIVAEKIKDNNISITIDEAMNAWFEHDALHYLGEHPFTDEGERHVVYLEKMFNRGWLPFGEEYNIFEPKECDYSHITQELITEISELIESFYD